MTTVKKEQICGLLPIGEWRKEKNRGLRLVSAVGGVKKKKVMGCVGGKNKKKKVKAFLPLISNQENKKEAA